MIKPKKSKSELWPKSYALLVVRSDGSGPCWMVSKADRPRHDVHELREYGWTIEGMVAALNRSRVHVVIVPNCWQVAHQLGIWELINEGWLELRTPDGSDAIQVLLGQRDPCVLPLEGKYWIDPHNWGLPQSQVELPIAVADAFPQTLYADSLLWHDRLRDYDKLLMSLGDPTPHWRLTAASTAWHLYRENYTCMSIPDVGDWHDDLVPQAIYSGRCECSMIGRYDGPVYEWDMRQAYSWAASHPLPCSEGVDVSPESLSGNEMIDCLGDVTVSTDHPLLPFRLPCEVDSITIFPTGSFRTKLCGPELLLAARAGLIRKVHRLIRFETSPWLALWARHLWAMRRESPLPDVVKKLTVSLYGRFSKKQRRWIKDSTPHPMDCRWGDWYVLGNDGLRHHRSLGGDTYRLNDREYDYDTYPIAYGWLTSMVRVHMAAVMSDLAGCVLYCDTDGMLLTEDGHNRMLASRYPGELCGDWRYVARYPWVHIHGYRDLDLGGKRRKAGIPVHAVEEREGFWRWEDLPSMDESLGERKLMNGGPVLRHARRRTAYRHGHVGDDGTVQPLKMDCDLDE